MCMLIACACVCVFVRACACVWARASVYMRIPICALIHIDPIHIYVYPYIAPIFFPFSFITNTCRCCRCRGSRVRQLRSNVDTAVASRWHGPLSVQCVWTLSQDERPEPTAHQTEAPTGKCRLLFASLKRRCRSTISR